MGVDRALLGHPTSGYLQIWPMGRPEQWVGACMRGKNEGDCKQGEALGAGVDLERHGWI